MLVQLTVCPIQLKVPKYAVTNTLMVHYDDTNLPRDYFELADTFARYLC